MAFFTVQKIEKYLKEIRAAAHREVRDIPVFKYHPGDCPEAHRPEFDDRGWQDFSVGGLWGGYDITAWFRARVSIPDGWNDRRLYLRFLVGPRDEGESTAETMLYVNGSPLQGIDIWHDEAWLPPETLQAGEISIALKAWSGVLAVPARRRFKLAQLIWIDEDSERLAYLTDTLIRTIKSMDENDLRRFHLLQAVHKAYLIIDFGKPGSECFYGSVAQARRFLEQKLKDWQSLDEIKPAVTGIGHAHIDVAWLWRLRHSREKAARTFATVLNLMRQYPEYRFLHSSPQMYRFLESDYPEIFSRVRERIEDGSWEITGATWVEPDTNIPNGESLVRQFLFGKRYARDTFGIDMKLLWLPDVFGYSAALPQIMRKSGIDYFMTTKISWSQFNRFPNDTFLWRGLDGTEVLTHFVTTPEEGSAFYTYNGQMRPEDVRGIWNAYRQKDINDELLLIYGWGDGGGGPTREMIEWSLAQKNLPGQPRVQLGKAEPYFERLAQRLEGENLPVWDGELYLEFHRGTYTSQASTKRANRKTEILYHNAEWAAALAGVLTGQANYPAAQLNTGWDRILLNQFHDILPGSSIREVYEDALDDYAQAAEIGEQALDEAVDTLLARIPLEGDGVVVFNPLSWRRDGLVALKMSELLDGKTLLHPGGSPSPTQVIESDGEPAVLVAVDDIPALGYRAYPLVQAAPAVENPLVVTPTRMENAFYAVHLDERGQITSIYDRRAQRELLPEGCKGNVLQAFEDKPMAFDAWDIDIYYQEKMREVSDLVEAIVEETGPLRGTLRLTWRFNRSTIQQRLRIYAYSPRIDFDTQVDWHEQQVLLKAAFPVDVRATKATYEIQFGSVERPTHWNTSWDWARFEVSGHKWADLSEGNYGAALLNDCKYGYDIKDGVMRLTLIKSAVRPDALADKGRHAFTYSLLPHAGDWREGDVTREAYALNLPLIGRPYRKETPENQQDLPAEFEFITLPSDHIILETVKKAEQGGGWVLRLYEYGQKRQQAVNLTLGRSISRAVECDLMEENHRPAAWSNNSLTFDIEPFEIKTFMVWFEPQA